MKERKIRERVRRMPRNTIDLSQTHPTEFDALPTQKALTIIEEETGFRPFS